MRLVVDAGEVLEVEVSVDLRGAEVRVTEQFLHGHRDVSTTMVYTHVLNRGGLGVRSPADRLLREGSAEDE